MIAIFELGNLWFWLLLVAICITITAVQELADSPGTWSTIWVIVTFVVLYYFGAGLSIKQLGLEIYHNPLRTVVYFLVYTLLGVLWSFTKWSEVVDEAVEDYKRRLKKKEEFKEQYPNNHNFDGPVDEKRPKLDEHKGLLFNWIFYWPFSFLWYIVHEPIERLFRGIIKHTRKVYEGITNRAYSKVQK